MPPTCEDALDVSSPDDLGPARSISRSSGTGPSNTARATRMHQRVWVLKGAIDITLGEELFHLREGDCLAMELDRPTMFHNPTRKTTRYAVVIVREPTARKR